MRLLVQGMTDCGATDIRPSLPPVLVTKGATPRKPDAEGLAEWQRITRECSVSPVHASVLLLTTRKDKPPRPGLCVEEIVGLAGAEGWRIIENVAVCPTCCAAGVRLGIFRFGEAPTTETISQLRPSEDSPDNAG